MSSGIVYEKTPVTQLKDYQALRRSTESTDGADLADEEVKLFLPKSFRSQNSRVAGSR